MGLRLGLGWGWGWGVEAGGRRGREASESGYYVSVVIL